MRKAVSSVISTVILLLIMIIVLGSSYTFILGYYQTAAAKTIIIARGSEEGNKVIIQNLGTETIQPGDITVLVNGVEAQIQNPPTIPPGKAGLIEFIPPFFGENLIITVISPLTGSFIILI